MSSPAGSFGYGFGAANPASALFRTLTLPNYASITNHFDSLARLDYTALVNYWGHVLDGYSYSMDPLGLRTNITRNLGLTTNTVSVGYDNIEQITSWSAREFGDGLRLNEQFGFGFDRAGNLFARTNGGLVQSFNCDALNQLTNVTRNSVITVAVPHPAPATSVTVNGQAAQRTATSPCRHQPVAGRRQQQLHQHCGEYLRRAHDQHCHRNLTCLVVLQWDANGNLTNDGTRSFAYSAENQLTNTLSTALGRQSLSMTGWGGGASSGTTAGKAVSGSRPTRPDTFTMGFAHSRARQQQPCSGDVYPRR